MLILALALVGALNPQVTQQNLATTVCASGWSASIRPTRSQAGAMKRRLMKSDGIPATLSRFYALDHVVPLEVGGAPLDVANFMLQPTTGIEGSHAKDRVEDAAHRELCAGRWSLDQARAVFQTDWRVEFRRRFPRG